MAESQRIDAFEPWCWRRLLKVSCAARSNQPILREINPEYSLEELMLFNCAVSEDFWESPGLHGDQTSQSWRKSTLNIHWKDWCWSWSSSILVTWYEQLTHWKSPWCWERLRAEEEGVRGWHDWVASLMQSPGTWANSGRWWGTGRPGLLQFMGSQSLTTGLVVS